jgi:putative ABC transport system ATP-binding protein
MSFTGRSARPKLGQAFVTGSGFIRPVELPPREVIRSVQQQRVAVARALANRPRLVLADEPTGALDAKNAQQVLELIRNLCTEVGASLMMVTHDLQMASQLPRVVQLSDLNRAA